MESDFIRFRTSLLILAVMLGTIFTCLFYIKTEPHLPLILCLVFLALFGKAKGQKWSSLEKGMVSGIQNGIQPILVLALIGMLIAAWMFSGTIPTVIDFSLSVIQPQFLLITGLISCMIVSMLVGSSFTTVSTVGVALMGIAAAAGIPLEWAAGAVICGACFGDKMSPMSDTTNFAAGVAEISIIEHIRHMTKTTIPAILLTAVIFFIMGRTIAIDPAGAGEMKEITKAISAAVNTGWFTLISPIIVVALAMLRKPIIPTLIIGLATAGLTGILAGNGDFAQFMTILQNGTKFEVANEQAASILNRGGLQSMMWSISLIMIAFALGGLMEKLGVIQSLMNGLIKKVRTRGQLIASTAASSVSVNFSTGEQYMSILIPGQSLKPMYGKLGIPNKYMSRTLEDAGTLVNPLVPWGVSGAFFAQSLGVDVVQYLPFAFFLYLSPIFSILFGFLPDKKADSIKLAA
ncbi:Na+/H+ antiporter NhaC [Bacillus sp. FJAT-42376]|uniref:Na+/H+ antiporter NhaC n=1 Tax=Bacillus sp. FJAT-42376 TaxID=2014076 RepID=UPI000F4D8275|nr:Na+/H+ antiporter NhaC [Bacillus sp. FJAT-42376]AZB42177.1 Na+/H+ antiporter NhaC [Bacillus sp. FJAT-42376]